MADNHYQNMLNRLIDEKYTFTYKKLVVPMSMRSPYWKYFGFPATEEGSILTKVKIICVLCKTQIAYNKNTSNLRMHLQNRHPNELAELVAVHPPENRPSPKVQRQSQFSSGPLVLKVSPGSGDDSKAPRKRKFHRMLENTNSGFVKQGTVYATPVDGSIEIEGDLQFISDPTINISSFADEEYENPVPTSLQILGSTSTNAPVVVVENSNNNQTESTTSQPANRIRIEGMSTIESKSICDAITDMIISDLITPDIVEKHGFQSLVATLRSPCEIPSTSRLINEVLPGVYTHVKNNARTLLENHHGNIGLSLEEWKSKEGDTMVTMSAHFLHKSNTKLETRVLKTFHSPYDVTHNWTADVDAVLADWQLDLSKVTAVIASSGQQSLLEVFKNKGITVVPCLLYSIQVAARSCFEMDEVSHVLGKARALLNAFKKDLDDESTLKFQDQVFHLEEPLVLDYPAVWLTTYHMIEQLQMFRTLVRAILESGSEPIRQLWLADEEWDTLEELLAVLEPLRVAVLTLAEERVPLLSLLEPLLWQLIDSHLQTKDEDSAFVLSLKKQLSDHLSRSYSDYSCRLMLRTSTQLDPRFKGLPHSDEAAKNTVVQQLHRSLENDTEEDTSVKEIPATPSKKNRLSGLLGKLCPDKSTSERAKNEFDQYNSMGSAALDSCPLEWWVKNAGLCPKLVKIARRHLCLLSCAIPLQRIPHTQQTAFHQTRSALSFDIADILLFLNANYSRSNGMFESNSNWDHANMISSPWILSSMKPNSDTTRTVLQFQAQRSSLAAHPEGSLFSTNTLKWILNGSQLQPTLPDPSFLSDYKTNPENALVSYSTNNLFLNNGSNNALLNSGNAPFLNTVDSTLLALPCPAAPTHVPAILTLTVPSLDFSRSVILQAPTQNFVRCDTQDPSSYVTRVIRNIPVQDTITVLQGSPTEMPAAFQSPTYVSGSTPTIGQSIRLPFFGGTSVPSITEVTLPQQNTWVMDDPNKGLLSETEGKEESASCIMELPATCSSCGSAFAKKSSETNNKCSTCTVTTVLPTEQVTNEVLSEDEAKQKPPCTCQNGDKLNSSDNTCAKCKTSVDIPDNFERDTNCQVTTITSTKATAITAEAAIQASSELETVCLDSTFDSEREEFEPTSQAISSILRKLLEEDMESNKDANEKTLDVFDMHEAIDSNQSVDTTPDECDRPTTGVKDVLMSGLPTRAKRHLSGSQNKTKKIKTVGEPAVRRPTCSKCGDKFSSNLNLRKHYRGHHNDKKYQCGKCKQTFTGCYSYKRHSWTHDRELSGVDVPKGSIISESSDEEEIQPYGCAQCGKEFSDRFLLTEHCATHVRGRPFTCTQCDMCFESVALLEKHSKLHVRTKTVLFNGYEAESESSSE